MITTAHSPAMQERVARSRDQLTPELAEDLIQLLGEGITELVNQCGRGNVVANRFLAMRDRLDMAAMVREDVS